VNGRRGLGELLTELADGVAAFAGPPVSSGSAGSAGSAGSPGSPVRVRSVSLSVPVDLRVASTDTGPDVVADVPLFRTRTAFDPDPARLSVEWHAVPLAPEAAP
jgi:hypothetical protein